jgi:hypothetical protein
MSVGTGLALQFYRRALRMVDLGLTLTSLFLLVPTTTRGLTFSLNTHFGPQPRVYYFYFPLSD